MSYLQKARVYLLEEAEPEMRGCWAPSEGNGEPRTKDTAGRAQRPLSYRTEARNQTRTAAGQTRSRRSARRTDLSCCPINWEEDEALGCPPCRAACGPVRSRPNKFC